ncbi:MAG: AI-2E family transporter [Methyloprofundus sp.]|nr:AI-2E family transporter [Methyloprofundus sp.]MBW6454020.1 AI-2E family transporter [Methyloprofundus sp.]
MPSKHVPILVSLAAICIIIAGMKAAAPILNPLFLSIFIAVICLPPLAWLNNKGISSSLAVFLVVGVLFIVVGALGIYVVSSVDAFAKQLPVYQKNLNQQSAILINWLSMHGLEHLFNIDVLSQFDSSKIMRVMGGLIASLGAVFADMFMIQLTAIFILFESYALPRKIHAAFGESNLSQNYGEIIRSINQYLAIKAVTSFVTGLLIAGWLSIIGVDFPVLWGVIAFMLNFVPTIGSIVAAVPTILLSLVQLGVDSSLLVMLGYFMVNVLVGNVWEPRIMGKGLGLSTLVVFLSLTFWGWVFGSVGMLLSVPFTMIAKIILEKTPETYWIAILLGSENDLPQAES